MSPLNLSFLTLDVFTGVRFLGNPLAIVKIPKEAKGKLTQTQKQIIAREFNLSETVFLHEGAPGEPIEINIFMVDAELPFAGHPTIGSGWYLLSQSPDVESVTLRTKAGNIHVRRGEGSIVRLRVPTNFKVHPPAAYPRTKALQPGLKAEDYVNGIDGHEAIASIVKGMTFLLLELTSEDALARVQLASERLHAPELGDWASFVGVYAFFRREDGVVRTRMIDGTLEDPATGSAASTLAGWLAKQMGAGKHRIQLIQGVEMGRKSEIEVVVDIDEAGEILEIELGGEAVKVMEGSIIVE
ncbi:hypothetical protein D9619_010332 [Psilocybe cf. subviscida]|uniref:Phenazine biosynthesis protein n=1 Tax=Psilocybe cf. subviscida TaxID=2480587 RepID=A0A8H5ASI2_9AGAR|nr:hypothetical protein D9619_010332 [Psilocybe cf. subviscida]